MEIIGRGKKKLDAGPAVAPILQQGRLSKAGKGLKFRLAGEMDPATKKRMAGSEPYDISFPPGVEVSSNLRVQFLSREQNDIN